MDLDEMDEYEFNPEGPGLGGAYPVNEYEIMESAWSEELDELDEFDELDELPGPQGPAAEKNNE